MKLIRIISLLLCIVICFSSCKMSDKKEEETTVKAEESSTQTTTQVNIEKKENITLPCNYSDGVNPYYAKSYENIFLADLLYEPLFIVDKTYTASPIIAKDIFVSGTSVTVNLNDGHKCHGSNNINANDVVYSFNMAKASYAYGGYLYGIDSAVAKSNMCVEFTLSYGNINVAGKLNFPIVKQGTADTQTDVPTGSGEYYFNDNKLISVKDSSKTISLFPIGESSSAADAFKIGNVDVYYSDLSDCKYSAISGVTNDILINNMVYLGLNSANGALSKIVRSAIATCVDSEDIAKFSYEGHAEPVKFPVSPNSSLNEKLPKINLKGDRQKAVSILDKAGYIRYSGNAKTNGSYLLTFSLIVNSDNKFRVAAAYNIADALNSIGFLVSVNVLSFEDYYERISSGNFDMYIGEIKLDGSGDIGGFFKDGTNYGMGTDKASKSATKYFEYLNGTVTQEEYYECFADEFPFVPICFRKGYSVSAVGVTPQIDLMPFGMYKNL